MHSLSRGFLDKPLQKTLLKVLYSLVANLAERYLVISSIKEKVKFILVPIYSNGNKTNHSS